MIIHVDMDAFFASIEQRDQPQLRGKPVAVGGSATGRGVVAAASYEARKFGVHSAMSGQAAARLCPGLQFVKSDMRKYAMVGRQVREIFHRYTPLVQPLSVDEAFLDASPTVKIFGSAEAIGRAIQNDIRQELNLPCSVGIAPLKFLAKIASDLQKPNGFVMVQAEEVFPFLDPLPIQKLWGVGKVTLVRLQKIGIHQVSDLRRLGQVECRRQLGALGDHLWKLASAIDPRTVVPDRAAKSIGHERTFHQDMDDDEFLSSAMSFLAGQVGRRLRAARRRAKQISIKFRLSDFRTFTRNVTLREPSDLTDTIAETAQSLLAVIRQAKPGPVRLIGLSLGHLTSVDAPQQLNLFDQNEQEKRSAIDQLSDQLQARFGDEALYRASGHQWRGRRSNESES